MSYFLQYTFGQHNDKTLDCFFDVFKLEKEVLILGFINEKKAYKIILNQDLSFNHFECYFIIGPLGNYTHHQLFSQKHIDLIKQEQNLNFSTLTEDIRKNFCLNETHDQAPDSLNYYFDFKNLSDGVMHHEFVYHGNHNMDMCCASLIKQQNTAYLLIYSNNLDKRYLKFKLKYEHNKIFVLHTEVYDSIFLKNDLSEITVSFSYVLQRRPERHQTVEPMLEFDDTLMAYFCIDNFA